MLCMLCVIVKNYYFGGRGLERTGYGRTLRDTPSLHLPNYPTQRSQIPGKCLYSTLHLCLRRGLAATPTRNISDLFKPKTGACSSVGKAKMAPEYHEEDYIEDSQSGPEDSGRGKACHDHPLTLADMSVVAADIKRDKKTWGSILSEHIGHSDQRDLTMHPLEKSSAAELYTQRRTHAQGEEE